MYEINLDRQLPTGIIPLNVIHNQNHKQPSELMLPLLNIAQTDVTLLKNTVLGSLNGIDNVDSIHEVSWEKIQNTKNDDTSTVTWEPQTQKLLPAFSEQSSFQIHANNNNKPAFTLHDADIPQEVRNQLNHMLNTECTCIVSKSSADFGRTNLVEMDLPTTGLPVTSKPYTIPLKYKTFCRQ